MSRILMLGGSGFIGSNLLLELDRSKPTGWEILTFGRSSGFRGAACVDQAHVGDFRDSASIEAVFRNGPVDMVFHLISATVPATSASLEIENELNLDPTVRLLDLMARYRVPKLVYLSSGGAIYGNSRSRHRESDPVSPVSAYGATKLAIEEAIRERSRQQGLQSLIVRPSNPYGPFHSNSSQGFVNLALQAGLEGRPLQVWGNGENRKDFIYSADCARAILDLVLAGAWGTTVNLGTGTEHSLNEILEIVGRLIPDFRWQYAPSKAFDVPDFALDTSKFMSIVGARSWLGLDEGIRRTLQWLKAGRGGS